MISAFGEAATHFARGLGDLEAVIAEPAHIVPAYFEALRRRELGERFYGMILADDPRVSLAYNVGLSIVNQFADIDMRARAFEMVSAGVVKVGEQTAAEVWTPGPMPLVEKEFLRLCSAMLVRSYTEFAKFMERSGGFARPVERVLAEPELVRVVRRIPDRPTVVIWAPQRSSGHIALHLFGLQEFAGDLFCVAADAVDLPPGTRVLTRDDPALADVLGRAGCVVCVEPNDPGDAVAFARQGFGVVAPLTAGAHEFAPETVLWDAANATTLHVAVSAALARPASIRTPYAAPPRVPVKSEAPLPTAELPRVSFIVPTYNRPHDLRLLLTAIAAQTYPNIEAIVVNDCGSPVAAVVADFPFARLFEHDVNRGSTAAVGTGREHATGEYIAFQPDDDTLYPDHVEGIMYALLRSGAKIAHANGMLRYVERLPDGGWKTTGLNATLCSETLTPTTALIATPVSENGVIQHRSVFDEAGWWLPESCLADLELHMRYGTRYVFVHVQDITFEFREHAGNQAKNLDFATELVRLYADVHPVADRPLLASHRRATHAAMAARIPGQPAFPPTLGLT